MYVTSIQSKVHKLNFSINRADYYDFENYVKSLNASSDVFYYCDSFNAGYALVISSDFDSAIKLMENFKIQNGTHIDGANYYASGRQDEITKYIANFHTKVAAQEFFDYLNDYKNPIFKGVSSVIRNSVIYFCASQTDGYDIGKNFEENYLSRILQKITDEPPQTIHPLDDEQKVYDFKEEVVPSENSTMNKIFSIFKVNSNNTDNNKDN